MGTEPSLTSITLFLLLLMIGNFLYFILLLLFLNLFRFQSSVDWICSFMSQVTVAEI